MDIKQVLVQPWTEFERGWGQRPDGSSIHANLDERNKYVEGYNKEYNNLPSAPDEYSKAIGDPEWMSYDALTDGEKKAFEAKRDNSEWRQYGIFTGRNLSKREEWYLG
jgi:hypothetical protein